MIQRMTTLSFGLFLCFICFKLKKNDINKVPIYDWILAIVSVALDVYIIATFDTLTKRGGNPTQMDIICGIVLILLVLEATRRAVGKPLVIVAVVFLLYAYLGPYLPTAISHRRIQHQSHCFTDVSDCGGYIRHTDVSYDNFCV